MSGPATTPMDRVAGHARTRPRSPALVLPDRVISWREMEELTDITARRLRMMGIASGDRVAFAASPSLEAAQVIHALPRLGAVLVLLSPDEPDPQRIADAAAARLLDPIDLRSEAPGPAIRPHRPDPQEPRAIVFTSGSSGERKGIVLTHDNLDSAAHAAAQTLRLMPGDRWLACLPLDHVGGLSIFLRAALVGFAVIPLSRFSVSATIREIRRCSASAVSLVPTMLVRLLDAGWNPAASLRFVLLGGGPAPDALVNRALDEGAPVAPSYGMTEASSQIATMTPWMPRKVGTVGPSLPEVHVRIGASPSEPVPAGDAGPIWIAGNTVSRHTIDGPLPLVDGWYATNDLGILDSSGYLKVLGRVDEIIVTGGEKVSPQEVEEALAEHPKVSEAAVVGLPDLEWGQRVAAAVVPAEGERLDPDELNSFMHERLVHHKVPKSFTVLYELPRTGPGKVDRAQLRRVLLWRLA